MVNYLLDDRSAIVTGAGSGIGRAVALELAASGAAVLVADISEEAAVRTAEVINSTRGTAEARRVDVTDPRAVELMVEAARALAPLRIAVNNAGIPGAEALLADYPLEDWQRVMDVNLNSVFYSIRAEIPAMIAAGGGSIINMASVTATVGFPAHGAYATTKHGIVGLTKNAALEYATAGVRVNAVGPGFITTPLVQESLAPAAIEFLSGKHALGRMGSPEEVAHFVAFLASDDASFLTGAFYPVDGGYTAQ